MKAIGINEFLPVESASCFVELELEMPHPVGHDILVRVEAISVNPVDTKVRAPKDQTLEEPKILGWDACGTVVSVGESVSLFSPGDVVFYAGDISRQGCNSEFHIADERICGKAPKTLSASEAAALPLTSLTAWEALFERMQIPLCGATDTTSKPRLLIIGAAGGVGSMAIQIASKLAGIDVIATASRPETQVWCQELGANLVLNHKENLLNQLRDKGIHNVDYILCCQTPDPYFELMIEAIKPQGDICSIVDSQQALDMNKLKPKSARFSWEFMFTRALHKTPDQIEQHHILNEVAGLIDKGILKGTLKEVLSPINAENLRKAHTKLESGTMIGKLVLEGWS